MLDKSNSGFLSDNTRKIRRGLMIACMIGFTMAKVGLIIKKISIFGTELAITNFEVIPFVIGLAVLYYLLTFISYGFDEYSSAYKQMRVEYYEKIESGRGYSRREILAHLKLADQELGRLETSLQSDILGEKRNEIEDKIRKKEIEFSKLMRVDKAYLSSHYKRSFFERFRFRYLREFMELYAPIVIGIYIVILLFFFTSVPTLIDPPKNQQKAQVIENIQADEKSNESLSPKSKEIGKNGDK